MKNKGFLHDIDINEVPDFLSKISKFQMTNKEQVSFRNELLSEWDDVTEVIVSNIINIKKKN